MKEGESGDSCTMPLDNGDWKEASKAGRVSTAVLQYMHRIGLDQHTRRKHTVQVPYFSCCALTPFLGLKKVHALLILPARQGEVTSVIAEYDQDNGYCYCSTSGSTGDDPGIIYL